MFCCCFCLCDLFLFCFACCVLCNLGGELLFVSTLLLCVPCLISCLFMSPHTPVFLCVVRYVLLLCGLCLYYLMCCVDSMFVAFVCECCCFSSCSEFRVCVYLLLLLLCTCFLFVCYVFLVCCVWRWFVCK